MNEDSILRNSERIISNMGLPAYTKGYYYICYAVLYTLQSGLRKALLYKDVYVRIAEINDVTVDSVEKCIRNTIKLAWDNSRDRIGMVFSYRSDDQERPTNSELIEQVASRLRLERKEGF